MRPQRGRRVSRTRCWRDPARKPVRVPSKPWTALNKSRTANRLVQAAREYRPRLPLQLGRHWRTVEVSIISVYRQSAGRSLDRSRRVAARPYPACAYRELRAQKAASARPAWIIRSSASSPLSCARHVHAPAFELLLQDLPGWSGCRPPPGRAHLRSGFSIRVSRRGARDLGSLRLTKNREPCPGALSIRMLPPINVRRRRQMARPRPLPPYRRVVEPSACENDSKTFACASGAMPIPVSCTHRSIVRVFLRLRLERHANHHLAGGGELDRVAQADWPAPGAGQPGCRGSRGSPAWRW